jgi:hypothetical protein
MKSFAEYIVESKSGFREIPEDTQLQAKTMAEKYFNKAKDLNSAELKAKANLIKQDPTWKQYFKGKAATHYFKIGNISFIDLQTNKKEKAEVLVIYGYVGEMYALYDQIKGKNIILLFDHDCKDLSVPELEDYIIHELVHGFQEYKETSPEYDAEVEKLTRGEEYDRNIYYTEPVELDAYLTQIGNATKKQFNALKIDISNAVLPETKRVMENRLEKFLLGLENFIRSPMKSYFLYKELPIPTKALAKVQEFLETIDKNEKLKNSFKLKMTKLYNKLTTL